MHPIGPVSPHYPSSAPEPSHYLVTETAQKLGSQIQELAQTLSNLTLTQANDPAFIQQTATLIQQLHQTALSSQKLC